MREESSAAENLVEVIPEPLVSPIVDHGVHTAIEHGQPVEKQKHMLSVPGLTKTVQN